MKKTNFFFSLFAWVLILAINVLVNLLFFPGANQTISLIIFTLLFLLVYNLVNKFMVPHKTITIVERNLVFNELQTFEVVVNETTTEVLSSLRENKNIGIGYENAGFREGFDFKTGKSFIICTEQALVATTIPELLKYINSKGGKTAGIEHLLHALNDSEEGSFFESVLEITLRNTDSAILILTEPSDKNSDYELVIKFNNLTRRPDIAVNQGIPGEQLLAPGLVFTYVIE